MFDTLHIPKGARRQRGFTLIEMSLVLVLMSMAISTFILLQAQQATDNQARAVSQTYARMNKAVSGYMQTYYSELINVDPACSSVGWAANNGTGLKMPTYIGCKLDLQINNGPKTTVANALQPTPKELAQLGFLEGGGNYEDRLPLPTLTSDNSKLAVTAGEWLVGGLGGTLPSRFMVLIQFMCLNGGTVFQFTDKTLCKSGTVDMRSLVFNSQPFNVEAADPSSQVLYQALDLMGSDGYLSGPGPGTNTPTQDTGELRAVRSAAEPTLRNPTRLVTGDAGAPFILAMRSGYGSSEWARFKRELAVLQTNIDNVSGALGNLNSVVNGVVISNNVLNTRVNSLSGTVDAQGRTLTNLSNTVTNLNNNQNQVKWRSVYTDDSFNWNGNVGAALTALSCSTWSYPVLSVASAGQDSGFWTNAWCDPGSNRWVVQFRNTSGGTQTAYFVSFEGTPSSR
jgi:prepilin-type N-terminal cleavage/methylation domain-containing protein